MNQAIVLYARARKVEDDPRDDSRPPPVALAVPFKTLPRRGRMLSGMMKPRLKVLTLAVEDLNRSLESYRDGLGLRTEGIIGQEFEHGAVGFFTLANDMIRALYPAALLSKDSRTATSTGS